MRLAAIVCIGMLAMLAVSTAASADCTETKYNEMFAQMETPWATFTEGITDGPDHNADGIPDPYQLALLAAAMCANPTVQATYDANLVIATQLQADDPLGWGVGPDLAPQIAAEAMYDNADWQIIAWYFGFAWADAYHDPVWWFFLPDVFLADYPLVNLPNLRADGDFDGDGSSNLAEYNFVAARGGSPLDFAAAATNAFAGPGVPVVGLVGLGLLAGACTLGGALSIRRKK